MCVCVRERERQRETERDRERQTDRQTDRDRVCVVCKKMNGIMYL